MDTSTVALWENQSEALKRAAFGTERVVLTRRGRKPAGIVPYGVIKLREELEDRKENIDAKRLSKRQLKKLER